MKKLLIMLLIMLVAGNNYLFAQIVGEPAPEFEADLLGGGTFKLKDQYASKLVFIFLFGHGCPSCIQVGTDIESMIYQEFKDHPNFAAIGLDTWDGNSKESTVEAFKNWTGITFPLGIKAGSIAAAYGNSYDHLIVIDQWGILVHNGFLVADNDLDYAKQAIIENLPITGIDELDNNPVLNIFPSPVVDHLQIDAGSESINGIEIYDISGKRVLENTYSGISSTSTISLSVQHLNQGFYFYAISLDGSVVTGKLLIQR